jgi:hypothetical protein
MSKIKKTLAKFGYDVGGLATVVDQESHGIAVRAVTENKAAENLMVMPDVKMNQKWKPMTDALEWQDSGCNKESEGTVTFGQKDLITAKIAIHTVFCNDDLIGLYPQFSLPRGAKEELQQLPFMDAFMNHIVAVQNDRVGRAWLAGDTTSMNPNLNKFDGLVKRITASGSVISAGTGAINGTNALARMQAVAYGLPEAVAMDSVDPARVYCSYTDFNFYLTNIATLNLFHQAPERGEFRTTIYGTGVELVVLPGIPAGYVFAGKRSDFMLLTNLEAENTDLSVVYDDVNDNLIVKGEFYLGTQIGFDNQIVRWTPAGS